MHTTVTTLADVSAEQVRLAVAEFLRIDPERIDPTTSLTAYGIDSLGALELVASLEDRFECTLPESLLTDCPDLDRLASALAYSGHTNTEKNGRRARASRTLLDRMLADSRLPDDVRPTWTRAQPPVVRTVVLTGATGFLGAFLLRALIDSGAHVVCLVRPAPRTLNHARYHPAGWGPWARVRANVQRFGVWREGDEARVTALIGDIEEPRLGLQTEIYDQLAADAGAVYHAAADVNWVSPYDALRSANVNATTTLLRFACAGVMKRFHFISSLSVCFAHEGPLEVTEDTDMLGEVDRLPLGYAQSKCVAESLVRQAAARGLPAQIFRPALLAGHSVTGASNVADLTAALLKGCIQMGAAPDLDWVFDAVPVDIAARTIVHLSRRGRSAAPAPGQSVAGELETFHLRHPRPRHWRECVLWANFFGYPIRLEPYPAWVERLMHEARTEDHALFRLRSFFTRRPYGRTVPEQYEEHARSRVDCRRTQSRERAIGTSYPPLGAELLDLYFQDYIARAFLAPPAQRARSRAAFDPDERGHTDLFESLLRAHFADERLRIDRMNLVQRGSEHSIISELTSWQHRRRAGLFHYSLDISGTSAFRSLDLVAKIKPPDEDVLNVAETTAAICDPGVHRELTRFRDRIGVRGGHLRELKVYELQADRRFRDHMPLCYGTWRDEANQSWGLLLERLDGMAVMDAAADVSAWTEEHIAAAIDGIADVHAAWLGREGELQSLSWIGHVPTRASTGEMSPLWAALADHAAPMFARWAGASLVRTHAEIVETIPAWWPALEALPRTLIHNDFNARNVGIRRTASGPRLVVYDWELATIGAPQHDLAEFLCFTLPASVDGCALSRWVERHRVQLERQSGCCLSREAWHNGFRSALADVLITRLAFYALIHRVRPQAFLPRVVCTWLRLYQHTTKPDGRFS